MSVAVSEVTATSGRGFLGGRPRGRLTARTLPLKNSRPPQTPYGSRRANAAWKQASWTGHSPQKALARAMSSSCSEKNSATRFPVPSLHRALAHTHSSSWSNSSFSRRSASISVAPLSVVSDVCVSCVLVVWVLPASPEKAKGRREHPGGLGAFLEEIGRAHV